MKKDFSFVSWLTKKDIKNILAQLDLKLDEGRENDRGQLNPIRRYTDEYGEKHIIVFCKNAIKTYEDMIIDKYTNKMSIIFPYMEMNDFYGIRNTVLHFTDFELQETFSIKNEEVLMDQYTKLNKIYNSYMTKKFGDFYAVKRKSYIKNLIKQEKLENAKFEENNDKLSKDFEK